jgi:hypothetical protein
MGTPSPTTSAGVHKLKDATPDGVLLGSGKLATEPDIPFNGTQAVPTVLWTL